VTWHVQLRFPPSWFWKARPFSSCARLRPCAPVPLCPCASVPLCPCAPVPCAPVPLRTCAPAPLCPSIPVSDPVPLRPCASVSPVPLLIPCSQATGQAARQHERGSSTRRGEQREGAAMRGAAGSQHEREAPCEDPVTVAPRRGGGSAVNLRPVQIGSGQFCPASKTHAVGSG